MSTHQEEDDLLSDVEETNEENPDLIVQEVEGNNQERPNTSKGDMSSPAQEDSVPSTALVGLREAIVMLSQQIQNKESSNTKRGKRSAANQPSNMAAPAKKQKTDLSYSEPPSCSMSDPNGSTDCQNLYESVLNSNSDKDDARSDAEEGDMLVELLKEYESDDAVGEKITSEPLAKLVNKMFRCKLAPKMLKDRMDKQERPSNCETAKPPRVNPGIWRRLRDYTRKRDVEIFKIQQALIKGILPIIRITDKVINAKSLGEEDCQSLKKFGLESMSLLTHASYELNMQRRQLMRQDIGKEYGSLCSSQLPFTEFLFGDDLQKHLKDIGDQNKIGAKINPNKGKQRYDKYGSGRSYSDNYKAKNWKGQNHKPWKSKKNQDNKSNNR